MANLTSMPILRSLHSGEVIPTKACKNFQNFFCFRHFLPFNFARQANSKEYLGCREPRDYDSAKARQKKRIMLTSFISLPNLPVSIHLFGSGSHFESTSIPQTMGVQNLQWMLILFTPIEMVRHSNLH